MRTIYVAIDNKNGIGKNGTIPWHCGHDMRWFKEKTLNSICIMGRKTWESLGKKPLKDRQNVIITSNLPDDGRKILDGCCVKSDLSMYLLPKYLHNFLANYPVAAPISIIGGAELYKFCLDNKLVDEIWLSRINLDGDCDTFFPEIPKGFIKWEEKKIHEYYSRERYIWYQL